MAVANIKAQYNCGVKKLWDIITSFDNYSWRRDISTIEVVEAGKKFVEYTKDVTARKWFMKPFVGMYLKNIKKHI